MAGILEQLEQINPIRSEKGYNMKPTDWKPSQWGNAIAGETGEMCNMIKKLERGDYDASAAKAYAINRIGSEAGDVVIYLDLLCTSLGISLTDAIRASFNDKSNQLGVDIKLD